MLNECDDDECDREPIMRIVGIAVLTTIATAAAQWLVERFLTPREPEFYDEFDADMEPEFDDEPEPPPPPKKRAKKK